jgi:hypothetical protein
MSFYGDTGLGVNNFSGPRTALEGMGGHVKTEGAKKQMVLEFAGTNINDGVMDSVVTLPANALVVAAYADVETAVTMTGTSPTILIGTNGSEVTNGLVISEAQAEAAGVYDVSGTLTGTWAAGLLTDTAVSVTLGGTTPTVTNDGHIKVVIEYVTVSK